MTILHKFKLTEDRVIPLKLEFVKSQLKKFAPLNDASAILILLKSISINEWSISFNNYILFEPAIIKLSSVLVR